jgi:hypothetical protein
LVCEWQIDNSWFDFPIDIRALPDFLYPEDVVRHLDDSGCLIFTAGEIAEGIGLSLQVLCRYQPPPDNYIFLKTEQYTGSFGQALRWHLPDWNAALRTSLEAGDVIEAIDRDIACDTYYTYTLQVGYTPIHGQWHRPMSDQILIGLQTAPCASESIGDALFLNVEPVPDENAVRTVWGFSEGGDWATQLHSSLESEEVEMRLYRYFPNLNIQDYIPIEPRYISPLELPGATFEYIETDVSSFCDEPLFYTLTVQDPGWGLIPFHVYAQKALFVHPVSCPELSGLQDLEFSVTPSWHRASDHLGEYYELHADINIYLSQRLLARYGGWDIHLVVSPLEEFRHVLTNRVLTINLPDPGPGYLEISESVGPEAGIECGRKDYVFFFEHGEVTSRSRRLLWTSPPCPPAPPILENLHAISDCPESSTGSCIVANWSLPDDQEDRRMPLEQVFIKVVGPGYRLYNAFVPSEEGRYILEIEKPAPESQGDWYSFEAYGCTTDFIYGAPSNRLSIRIPPTPDSWDFWSFD